MGKFIFKEFLLGISNLWQIEGVEIKFSEKISKEACVIKYRVLSLHPLWKIREEGVSRKRDVKRKEEVH